MAAIAQLKALLGIDTSEYRAGMKEAEDVTHSFAMKLQDTEKKIANTAQISRGFAAVMSGNVAGGIKQIVSGLDMVTSKAAMAVAELGALAAAAGAGWAVGKKLDKWFGISDSFKYDPERNRDDFGDSERRFLKSQRKESQREASSIGSIEAEIQKEKDGRLKGLAKMARELEVAEEDISKRIAEAKTEKEKEALGRLLDVKRQHYQNEVAMAKKAEADKLEAARKADADRIASAKKAEQDKIDSLNAQYDKRMADVESRPFRANGSGIRADQIAAVGGFVGIDRSGIAAADKQLQIAIEMNRRDQEKMRLEQEKIELLNNISDNTGR